jgi:hypothetical protein
MQYQLAVVSLQHSCIKLLASADMLMNYRQRNLQPNSGQICQLATSVMIGLAFFNAGGLGRNTLLIFKMKSRLAGLFFW